MPLLTMRSVPKNVIAADDVCAVADPVAGYPANRIGLSVGNELRERGL